MNNSPTSPDFLVLAKKLIIIPSTADNPKALNMALDVAKKELQGTFQIDEFEQNGVKSMLAHGKTHEKKFKVILNAHLDVVPGKKDQFMPYEKNGKLYGRGAYDMKAAAAVMILVFKEVASKISYPLALQLVTDEEIGGFSCTKHQIDRGLKADFVIAGENTNLKINNKSKGILWLKLKASGKTAHGAYPWQGENALHKLQEALLNINKLYPHPEKEEWRTMINLARIETDNDVFNKVPDSATAYLDIRYIPEDRDLVLKKIKTAVSSEKIEVEIIIEERSQYTDEDCNYISELKKQIEDVTKHKAEMLSVHGGSDVRFFEEKGIETVCFGPIGGGHHSDNEWVDINSLEQYYQILKNFLIALDKK